VRLVEYDDAVLAHLLGYLVGDFRVEEVVEGVDDDVCVGELRRAERASGKAEDEVRYGYVMVRSGRTIRRMVKYGQTPFSLPYRLTSSRVKIPAGIRLPAS
jgi:hypothetical protein